MKKHKVNEIKSMIKKVEKNEKMHMSIISLQPLEFY